MMKQLQWSNLLVVTQASTVHARAFLLRLPDLIRTLLPDFLFCFSLLLLLQTFLLLLCLPHFPLCCTFSISFCMP